MRRITLNQALAGGNLEPFIRQAEADGVGPVDQTELEGRLGRLVRAPQREGQTSRSRARDGSRGK
jgi:hypothetical protein